MTQDQYLELKQLRHYFEALHNVGSVHIPAASQEKFQQLHEQIFGGRFNAWCQVCMKEAMTKLFVEADKYEAAGAPVIISGGQKAEVKTRRKRA